MLKEECLDLLLLIVEALVCERESCASNSGNVLFSEFVDDLPIELADVVDDNGVLGMFYLDFDKLSCG